MDHTIFRTAPGAQSVPSASKVMLPLPLLGKCHTLPIKHSAGASSKIVFTLYAVGTFSLSTEYRTHWPFTPLRHEAAEGPPSTAPCWAVQDVKKATDRRATKKNNVLFMFLNLLIGLRNQAFQAFSCVKIRIQLRNELFLCTIAIFTYVCLQKTNLHLHDDSVQKPYHQSICGEIIGPPFHFTPTVRFRAHCP